MFVACFLMGFSFFRHHLVTDVQHNDEVTLLVTERILSFLWVVKISLQQDVIIIYQYNLMRLTRFLRIC